jgi:hypothetical protein
MAYFARQLQASLHTHGASDLVYQPKLSFGDGGDDHGKPDSE